MELLAIYIEGHFLFEEPQYFNFGGKFFFQFTKSDDGKIVIQKKINIDHISEFYGETISNISAIVGNNGVGKTSILRILSQEPNHEIISVYNDGGKIYLNKQMSGEISVNFDYEAYDKENELYPLYYSSQLDVNLKSIHSPISQSNLIEDSLSDYYFDNIQRQILFLHANLDSFIGYPELPKYENIRITVNNVSKADFLKNDFFKKADIGKSMREQLKMVWDDYFNEKSDMIHDGYDFISNFEIFILSLLVTDDMYSVTNNNTHPISFQEVMNEDKFLNKLDVFLKKRISNIDGPLYNFLEENSEIKIENKDELIDHIEKDKISKISGGFDFNRIKASMIQTILRFSHIHKLYKWLLRNESVIKLNERSEIILSVRMHGTYSLIEEFLSLYQAVHNSLQYLNFNHRLFNIRPDIRLSHGEQSLLNFYSSIYSFALKKEHHLRKFKQYLFLLDEPEIGYHPVWKKKFIKSIKNILPVLMSNLDHKPKIQVIFTSHDPLTLSDLPNYCISYLKRKDNLKIQNFHFNDAERPKNSFGANVNDLLGNSFFLENELIGDFAKEKIDEVINWINKNRDSEGDYNKDHLEKNKKIIAVIDEPVIRMKLTEMISEIEQDENFIDKMIIQETAYLRSLKFKKR